MAEVVNLRLARKRKAREERQERATENRVRHGEKADVKGTRKAGREIEARRLEGHLLGVKPDATE
jgi:hypothetical protein